MISIAILSLLVGIFFVSSVLIGLATLEPSFEHIPKVLIIVPFILGCLVTILGIYLYQAPQYDYDHPITLQVHTIDGIDTVNRDGNLINLNSAYGKDFTDGSTVTFFPEKTQYVFGLVYDGIIGYKLQELQ